MFSLTLPKLVLLMLNKLRQINLDRKSYSYRNERGSFLVEALVAVLVASILGMSLMAMFVQVRRVGNMAQGELYAILVAQECMDQLRAQSFTFVNANQGVHYASLNVASADNVFPRPLMQDPALDYTALGNLTASESSYTFHTLNPDTKISDDSVKIQISNGGISNSISATVTINYLDTSGAVKSYNSTSLITRYGLNG